MRFENLSADYFEALKQIGIQNLLPLPKANATGKNNANFISYYSPEAIIRAKKVFGIYMSLLGYDFPKEWGDLEITLKEKTSFKLQNIYKHAYWKYLRYYTLRLEMMTRQN